MISKAGILSIKDVPKVSASLKFYISHIKNVLGRGCFQSDF